MADTTTMWLGFAGPESHSIESVRHCQLRNFHHRSVSGFAENCTLVGISSLSAATCSAGFAADGGRGMRGDFLEKSILTAYSIWDRRRAAW